jgi:DNA polymerase-4
VISHNKLEVKRCLISDKGLILETVKELLYQERMKDSVRLLGISLNNLNTEEKKSCRSAVKICF